MAQQLDIWENELNCLQEQFGVLIKFERPALHAEFKEFKNRKSIKCILWNDEWQDGKENVVVVDQSFERQAFDFINNYKN